MQAIKKYFVFILMCLCAFLTVACSKETGKVQSIVLSNYKTEFAYGEDFSVGDLLVSAMYDDGSTKTVIDYTVDSTNYNKTKAGKYNITIKYIEGGILLKSSYTVKVKKSEVVTSLELKDMKLQFNYGEEFSFDGVVQQKFSDGRLMIVFGYQVDSSVYNKDVAGDYEIKISHEGLETKYIVQVLPSMVIKDFSVSATTTKFSIGDSFVFDGTVYIEYEDGRIEENSQFYTVDTDYNAFKAGTYEVNLMIGEKKYSYDVTVEKAKTLKVLMIGNSYSDNTSSLVPMMAEALGFENIVVGNLFIGGCSLYTHYANSQSGAEDYDFRCYENGSWNNLVGGKKQSLEFGIKYKDWDFITMQQASIASGVENTYGRDLDNLINYVKAKATNKNVRFAWNMTWAYQEGYSGLSTYGNSQMQMYNAIIAAVKNKIESNNDFSVVLAAGTAIQNARTSYLGDTFNSDGTHLTNDNGCYIAGLTLFCTLTGYTPDEVTFAPSSMDEKEILVAKESVKNALQNRFSVTTSQYS